MRDIVQFLKQNPQAMILLGICLVLGLGTLIVLLFGLAASGPAPAYNDSDSGVIALFHVLGGL